MEKGWSRYTLSHRIDATSSKMSNNFVEFSFFKKEYKAPIPPVLHLVVLPGPPLLFVRALRIYI
jgi:hypothetical protein